MNSLIIISLLGVVAMLSEVFRFKRVMAVITVAGIVTSVILLSLSWNNPLSFFSDKVLYDNYSIAFSCLLLVIALIWMLIAGDFFSTRYDTAEHLSLLLFCLSGAMMMAAFNDLTVLFIGIEILSISLYVLAGSNKHELRSNEASMKYFLMGAFSTGFLLLGITLVYGASGSFSLPEIKSYLTEQGNSVPSFFHAGLLLILCGLLFKVSAVPLHFWAPDVYEGAPTAVTAFMSTLAKTAAFAALFRLFLFCFDQAYPTWSITVAVISALSMLAGNILAIRQTSLKRMLAYSSIAHAGYMLMALASGNDNSAGSLFYYALSYSVGSLGAFSVLHYLSARNDEEISALKGLSSDKGMAFAWSVIVLSLAGIPPTAGFFAKYFLWVANLSSGFIWLIIIALISSLLGVYFYFRMIITAFQKGDKAYWEKGDFPVGNRLLLYLCALLSLALGLFPGLIQSLFNSFA